MNNKGQSLTLFVIVLPILLLVLVLIIDVGKILVLKLELNNISEIVLDYGLDNIDNDNLENKLISLVKLNKSDIDDVNVKIIDGKIYIGLATRCKGLFSGLLNMMFFDVETSYVGYFSESKKRIERIGD